MVMNHILQIEFSVKTLHLRSLHMYTYSTYLKIAANNAVQLYTTEPRNNQVNKGILMNKISRAVLKSNCLICCPAFL
jgi:hypothetical protein